MLASQHRLNSSPTNDDDFLGFVCINMQTNFGNIYTVQNSLSRIATIHASINDNLERFANVSTHLTAGGNSELFPCGATLKKYPSLYGNDSEATNAEVVPREIALNNFIEELDNFKRVWIREKKFAKYYAFTKGIPLEKILSNEKIDSISRHINEIIKIDSQEDNYEAIEKVHSFVDEFIIKGDFNGLDNYIAIFLLNKYSLSLHISLLMAVRRFKKSVSKYRDLYENAYDLARQKCKAAGLTEDEIEIELQRSFLKF